MPNIATAFKNEISRVARKEVRQETASLKKAVSSYRTEIASLKRRAQALERQLAQLGRSSSRPPALADERTEGSRRFSAKGLGSHRRRLGLSAADLGLLLGASSQSIYNWEEGKVRPQAKHLPAIEALRKLGKRAAAAHLESVKASK